MDKKINNAETKTFVSPNRSKDKLDKSNETLQILLVTPVETTIHQIRPLISKVKNNNNEIVNKAVQNISTNANKKNTIIKNVPLRILGSSTLSNLKIYQHYTGSTVLNKIEICEKSISPTALSNIKSCKKNVKVSKSKNLEDYSLLQNHSRKCIILNKSRRKFESTTCIEREENKKSITTEKIRNKVVQRHVLRKKSSKFKNGSHPKAKAESTLKKEDKEQVFPVAIQKSVIFEMDQLNLQCYIPGDDSEIQILGI